jgi:hypothetical protein
MKVIFSYQHPRGGVQSDYVDVSDDTKLGQLAEQAHKWGQAMLKRYRQEFDEVKKLNITIYAPVGNEIEVK